MLKYIQQIRPLRVRLLHIKLLNLFNNSCKTADLFSTAAIYIHEITLNEHRQNLL